MRLVFWAWELKRQAEAGRRARRSLIPGRRVPGKARRRQPRVRPSGKLGSRDGRAKPHAGCKSHPFCTFALEAGLWQACFFLGKVWLKSLIGALWNRNMKGN